MTKIKPMPLGEIFDKIMDKYVPLYDYKKMFEFLEVTNEELLIYNNDDPNIQLYNSVFCSSGWSHRFFLFLLEDNIVSITRYKVKKYVDSNRKLSGDIELVEQYYLLQDELTRKILIEKHKQCKPF